MKISQDDKSKALTYGGNMLFNPLAGALNDKAGIDIEGDFANSYMALTYFGLDVLDRIFPNVRNNKFSRLAKAAGAGYYFVKSIAKTVAMVQGDYNAVFNLPFDIAMTYQLICDSLDSYQRTWDFSSGINIPLVGKIRNFVNKRTVPSP